MVFHLLQRNATSLIARMKPEVKPDIVCMRETWLEPHLEFILPWYESVSCDRGKSQGGGCTTFIRDGIAFRIANSTEVDNSQLAQSLHIINLINLREDIKKRRK